MSPALTRKEKQAKTRSALLSSAAKLICVPQRGQNPRREPGDDS